MDDRCYKYLPVITGQPPIKMFLIPGSRFLSNVSETESCKAAKKVPRGYLTTRLLGSSLSTREDPLTTYRATNRSCDNPRPYEKEAKGGAYMDRDLAEWARAFAWDARQPHKPRRKNLPVHGVCDQFRQGFSREQFTTLTQ